MHGASWRGRVGRGASMKLLNLSFQGIAFQVYTVSGDRVGAPHCAARIAHRAYSTARLSHICGVYSSRGCRKPTRGWSSASRLGVIEHRLSELAKCPLPGRDVTLTERDPNAKIARPIFFCRNPVSLSHSWTGPTLHCSPRVIADSRHSRHKSVKPYTGFG